MQQLYDLILIEDSPNFFTVVSPDLPDFSWDITGSFLEEALDRARRALNQWITICKDRGVSLPPAKIGSFVIYGAGMKHNDERSFWTKNDVMRNLSISRATLDRRVREGLFRKRQVGRKVLFDPNQIRQAVGL